MKPAFEELEPFEAYGITWRGTDNKEIPSLWAKFDEIVGPQMENSPSMLCFGICRDYDGATGEFSYMAGIMKGADVREADECETWSVPGGRWAVFGTTMAEIHSAFEFIMGEWTSTSGAVLRDAPMVERYPVDFDASPEARLEILVAIE